MSRQLPAALVERVIARYPLPVADAVATLVAAESVHEERDRVVEVFRVSLRWLAVLALAARGQYGAGDGEGPEVGELLAGLRRRGLTDGQWAALLRGVVRAWAAAPSRHPLPGLVRLLSRGAFWALVDGMLEMRRAETVAHGATGDDEALELLLERRVPQLAGLLDLLEGAWEGFSLVATAGERRARVLMGCTPPRGRWRRIELQAAGALAPNEPVLIDAQGKPALALAPLALVRRASPELPEELFVLDHPVRRGVLYTSLPAMTEHVDADAWPSVERVLYGGEAGSEEERERPYRGLESFGPEHAALFFGREEQADALAARVRRSAMVTVTGPSGSGKTSLLRAGVAPRLADHRVVELRPGADPCGALVRRLSGLVAEGTDPDTIGAVLRRSPEAVGQALGRWCESRGQRLLLLVDQAEELFTLCLDARARSIFGRMLVASAGDGASPVRVVLVVREDFFARLATIEAFQGVYSRVVEVVTTPDRAALARAVAMPAWRFGYSFDPSLVDRMVEAAADEPSALALLQFCADRLWEARDRRWKRVTAEAYEAIGGVEGALAAHAERTLRDLTPAQQGSARSMLLRLVTSEGTRALCGRSELLAAAGEARDGHVVLERLVEARLVIAREEAGGREASLELVHEALLRHWERLRVWQDQNREEQRRLDSLRRAAREWEARGRPRGLLWRDDILAEHRIWRRHTTTGLTDAEEDFLETSEAEESRASRWRRGAAAAVLGGLLLSLVVMAVQREEAVLARTTAEIEQRRAVQAREQAQTALRLSEVGRLTAEAGRRESLGRPGESMALLRAAASLAVPAADPLTAELRRLASLGDVPLVLRAGDGPVLSLAYTPDGRFLLAAAGAGARAWSLPSFRAIDLPHQGTVWAAAVSPDGRLALTASADRTAALWRLDDGHRVASLPHPAEVQAAAFARDGRMATGAADGAIRIFSTVDGAPGLTLDHHHQPVSTLAFSPDGARLAAGSRDRTATLWSVPDGALLRPLGPFDDPVSQAAFSPDGATLALVHKRTAELLRATGERVATLDGHEHLIHALAFSSDSARLVTASSDRTARLWDLRTGAALRVLAGHERAVLRASFSPDGRRLATASADGVVRLHDADSGVLLRTLRGPTEGAGALAFSPDGARLAVGSRADDGAVFLWDLNAGAPVTPLRGHGDDLYALAFSPDGSQLATASRDRTARLWDVATGAPRQRLDHREPTYALAFSPDGALLATASYERSARLWSVHSGKLLQTLTEHEGYVPALAFSPDGRRLATASVDRRLRLYDAASGKLQQGFEAHEGAPFGVSFSRDGRRVASLADDGKIRFFGADPGPVSLLPAAAGYAEAVAAAPGLLAAGASDGSATVWDVDQGVALQSVRGHEGAVLAVALSRDGRLLATGSSDQSAALWRVDTGAQLASLEGHTAPVLAVAISPEGSLVASGSADRTVRLWTSAGRLLAVLGGHDDKISALAFSPDGRLLASASHDDTARLWTLAPWRDAPPPFTDLGARSNLRVCRESGEVVAVLPLPPADSVWAPAGACKSRL